MTENKKQYNVYLGRFSPLHKGHEAVINGIINKYGADNLLIIIGSSTSHNNRTPYTFEERTKMLRSVYPNANVIGLPDIKPDRVFFKEDTNERWLKSIKEIEENMNAEFTFFGGSTEDLTVLAREFKTEVIIDRNEGPEKISATKVREALEKGDIDRAKSMINERIYSLVSSSRDETLRKV